MFPANNIFRLNESEKAERKENLNAYLRITQQIPDLLNSEKSFEFFKISEFAEIYFAPFQLQAQTTEFPGYLTHVHKLTSEQNFYWLLFSEEPPGITDSVVSSLTSFFSKKSAKKSGIALACIRDTKSSLSVLSYALQEKVDFSATSVAYNPNSSRVFIGSEDGSLYAFREKKAFEK